MTVLSNNRQLLRLIFGFNHHPVPVPPASFISLTFMPKPVLWGREKRPQDDKEGFGARKRDKSFFV